MEEFFEKRKHTAIQGPRGLGIAACCPAAGSEGKWKIENGKLKMEN